jgi:hypothetical protein
MLAPRLPQTAPVEECHRGLRVQLDGLVVVDERGVEVALQVLRVAPVVVDHRDGRVDGDGRVEIFHGQVVLGVIYPRDAPVVVAHEVARSHLDDLVVVGHRARHVALRQADVSAVVVGVVQLARRVASDGLVVIRERAVEVALRLPFEPAVIKVLRRARGLLREDLRRGDGEQQKEHGERRPVSCFHLRVLKN